MPYIDPKVIQEVKQIDLLTYLQQSEPQELMRISGKVYCTRSHDSLKISNGKWYWHSQGFGGRSALDYLIKVRNMKFIEAVTQMAGQTVVCPQPPRQVQAEKERPPLQLPPRGTGEAELISYLCGKRGISRRILEDCIVQGILYQSQRGRYQNAVFVGKDSTGTPRCAAIRGMGGNFKGEALGSDKRYAFSLPKQGYHLHLFESAIDLLSFATIAERTPQDQPEGTLLSLSGIARSGGKHRDNALPPALAQYLKDHADTKTIHLHLDNDIAGRAASCAIAAALQGTYAVQHAPPPYGKDYNDYLCACLHLPRQRQYERG